MKNKTHWIDRYQLKREQMINTQLATREIDNSDVLKAMRLVPRHLFVPRLYRRHSYEDTPLPIGYKQTISQPYMVAYLSQAIAPKSSDRILEIGTGCGYQAAILAQLCNEVFTIEVLKPLGQRARKTLEQLGYENVHIRIRDGYDGWPEAAPFDAIIVTAACPSVPEPLIKQLKMGGKIIIPVGKPFSEQTLIKGTRTKDGLRKESLFPVQFVPLTGKGKDNSCAYK